MPGVLSRLKELFTTTTSRRASWPKARGGAYAFDLRRFAEAHPRWADADELRARAVPAFDLKPWKRVKLKKHAFFAPWLDQIQATAAPSYQLFFRAGRAGAWKSRAGGDVAYLSCPWPECRTCGRPMDLVAQLQIREVQPLFKEQGSFAFFYCFHCQSRSHAELLAKLSGLLRWERPQDHSSERRPSLSRDGKPVKLRRPMRVEKRVHASFPPASAMFGPLADELFAVQLTREKARAKDVYEKWTATMPLRSQLCGHASVSMPNEQRPRCPECAQPMRLLLQVAKDAGFDFPDGGTALLFFCDRSETCPGLRDVRFVLIPSPSGRGSG